MGWRIRHNLRNWGVDYHYKSKHVMCIRTGDDMGRFLDVGISFSDGNDTMIIEKCLASESQDFQQQALAHLSGCDANRCFHCSTYSSGKYVTVLGKNHQICGSGKIGFGWGDPVEADLEIIKRLVEMRCGVIDEARGVKKN